MPLGWNAEVFLSMKSAFLLLLLTLSVAGGIKRTGDDDATVPYPEGYRHWTFLHASAVPPALPGFWTRPCVKPCTAGIFYFYANDKAMTGLQTGQYADGSVLTEEMLEWLGKESGSGKEGQRRVVGVMVKDSKRYSSTGGWGYGTFDGDSKQDLLDAAGRKTCYTCHIPRKDHDYVFSQYHER